MLHYKLIVKLFRKKLQRIILEHYYKYLEELKRMNSKVAH